MLLTAWIMNPPGTEYRSDLDSGLFVDCPVRVGRKIVGHVTRVIELRPEGVHIEMEVKGEEIPWNIDKGAW